ncbi:MAG: hypothetical protein D6755_08385, partial [Anaerolineae bacterium]
MDMQPEQEELKSPETTEQSISPKESESSPVLSIQLYSWATPIVALVALVVGLLGGYFLRPVISGEKSAPVAAGTVATAEPIDPQAALPATPPEDLEARRKALMDALLAQTKHFKGNPDAPVTILEFSDFQCPYCGRFFAEVEPQINQQYIENGQVRMGYIHFAFLGQESLWAAEASECAADQDAFWEFHDKLFNSQNGENRGAFSKDNLKKFAA